MSRPSKPSSKKDSRFVLITAGPTREALDPVRYLTNSSSGKMGMQLASALLRKRARVKLICGPTPMKPPSGVNFKPVSTAVEMNRAVKKDLPRADVFIATAAVGDFRFANSSPHKIKKGTRPRIKVTLLKNPDILKEAGLWKKKKRSNKPILVGFALETTRLQTAAARKLKEKNLDLIIGNSPASFSNSLIKPYWLERGEKGRSLPRMSKKNLSSRIANWIETKLK